MVDFADPRWADRVRARECARYFRKLGLVVLPSRGRSKIPIFETYTQFYDGECVPDEVYSEDNWRATNFQVITGTHHAGSLCLTVIDLDGEESQEVWGKMCAAHAYELQGAWVVESGSGTGLHIYFRLPDEATECKSGMLWGRWDTWGDDGKGKWEKHKEVRIFGDRALIVAPPSLHKQTGNAYRFREGCSPREFPLPCEAPAWLLAMPRLASPRTVEPPKPRIVAPIRDTSRTGQWYRRDIVMPEIVDKVSLARDWGLKVTSTRPNTLGWYYCHTIEEEKGASATIHHIDGTYKNWKTGEVMSLFDLGSRLQPSAFPRWQDCRDWCGDRFIGREQYRNILKSLSI